MTKDKGLFQLMVLGASKAGWDPLVWPVIRMQDGRTRIACSVGRLRAEVGRLLWTHISRVGVLASSPSSSFPGLASCSCVPWETAVILHLVVLLIPHGKLELNSWLPVLVSAKSQPCKHLDCESE